MPNSKLLLFGEYSVLHGSAAIAFPYARFSGDLVLPEPGFEGDPAWKESNQSLQRLLRYLESDERIALSEAILNVDSLREEVQNNLFFLSTIPQNYGVGSSGSLVAAVYNRFGWKNETSPEDLRTRLAFIESHFHSRSSGTDPLVCYLNRTVCLKGDEVFFPDITLEELRKFFSIKLIDSGLTGKTKHGVSSFAREPGAFTGNPDRYFGMYIPLVNGIIDRIINRDLAGLFPEIRELAKLQLELFAPLFTDSMMNQAKQKMTDNKGILKLCGSGGGGFYLSISPVG